MKDPQPDKLKGDILVVDDTPANLRLLSQMLAEQGFKVRPVPSGTLALMAVQAAPPDLILLDIRMPGMNGYEVCERLKANENTQDIPIIFISALGEVEDKVRAFTVGGVDYITKPFKFEEVLARVQTHLSLRQLYKQLQEANAVLEQRSQDLARSNAELEQFAYAVSHDLQEPLRMISSYLALLKRRYVDNLDEKGLEFIAYAVDGAQRMQEMIHALLTYARVDTRGSPFEPIEGQEILERVLMNLTVAIEESEAVVTHDDLPTVAVDATQFAQVFQNLISNALKFRGTEQPHVHISAVQEHDMWIFSVQDDGIGIDPEFHEEIFRVFRRLHTQQEYPGTGIGLATCKKIIERHGGRIWVESQNEQGATFYFTVPMESA